MPTFDEQFYLSQNPDVAEADIEARQHFDQFGFREGRDPSPFFDTSFYLEQNPDVGAAGVNPLDHYINFGGQPDEQRDPSPDFDTSYYFQQNPDVAEAGVNALDHFLSFGAEEGRAPNDAFDAEAYLAANPDVAEAIEAGVFASAAQHFAQFGRQEGRSSSGNGSSEDETSGGGGGSPLTFTVTEDGSGVVTFGGTATGDILISWSSTPGNSVATFTRQGVTGSTEPDFSGTGTANEIELGTGQTLSAAAIDVADLVITGGGGVVDVSSGTLTNRVSNFNALLHTLTASETGDIQVQDTVLAINGADFTAGNIANATLVEVQDTASNIAAADFGAGNLGSEVTSVEVSSGALTDTVANLNGLPTLTASGGTIEVQDTAANIASADFNTGNIQNAGTVTATTAATVAESETLAGFPKAVVYDVEGTAGDIATALGGTAEAQAGIDDAVDVTATGTATVAQADTIAAATNSGATTYEVADGLSAIVTPASDGTTDNQAGLAGAGRITVTSGIADGNEVVELTGIGTGSDATSIDFAYNAVTLTAAEYNTATTTGNGLDTTSGDAISVTTLDTATVDAGSADETFVFGSTDTGVSIGSFDAAGTDVLDTSGLGSLSGATAFTTAASTSIASSEGNQNIVVTDSAANDWNDVASVVDAAINYDATNDDDATSDLSVVLVDNGTDTRIYRLEEDGADTSDNAIDGGELTLIGTLTNTTSGSFNSGDLGTLVAD